MKRNKMKSFLGQLVIVAELERIILKKTKSVEETGEYDDVIQDVISAGREKGFEETFVLEVIMNVHLDNDDQSTVAVQILESLLDYAERLEEYELCQKIKTELNKINI